MTVLIKVDNIPKIGRGVSRGRGVQRSRGGRTRGSYRGGQQDRELPRGLFTLIKS
jgi:hypothetical protein